MSNEDVKEEEVQIYKRKVPKILGNALVKTNQPYNLYALNIKFAESRWEEDLLTKYCIIDPSLLQTTIGFISASNLPSIPSFPIFFRQQKAIVSIKKVDSSPLIDDKTMELIYIFNKYAYEVVLNKVDTVKIEFAPKKSIFPLLIVPLKKLDNNGWEFDKSALLPSFENNNDNNDREDTLFEFSEENYKNVVVYPSYRQSSFYFVNKILHNWNVNSPFPNSEFPTYYAYFTQKWKASIKNTRQPLLSVILMQTELNLCSPATCKYSSESHEKLIPELTRIHPLAANYWTIILTLPTVFHRLNQFLLVDELREMIMQTNLSAPQIDDILDYEASLTAQTVKTCRNLDQLNGNVPNLFVDSNTSHIFNKQPKIIIRSVPLSLLLEALKLTDAAENFNLERLETLGDSFLKFAVSNYLYVNDTTNNEGVLTISRSDEISNENLFKLSIEKELPSFMNASKFEPNNTFLPPCYVELEESKFNEQSIYKKSVSDAVEALIGAHVISLGIEPTLKFIEWLGIKVLLTQNTPISLFLSFLDLNGDTSASTKKINEFYNNPHFKFIETQFDYTFKNKAFLVQAFTHASYYKGRVNGNYQRLEFLGDAVLDYLVTRFLFEHKDRFAPGILTDLRSALVNNTILAYLTVKYGLHKALISNCDPTTNERIKIYAKSNEKEDNPPKILADIFESFIGAIFLDSEMNLDTVWKICYKMMEETYDLENINSDVENKI